jgi:hypothetical protein
MIIHVIYNLILPKLEKGSLIDFKILKIIEGSLG